MAAEPGNRSRKAVGCGSHALRDFVHIEEEDLGGPVNVRRRGHTNRVVGRTRESWRHSFPFTHLSHPVRVSNHRNDRAEHVLIIIDFRGQSLHMQAKWDLSRGLAYG